MKRPNRAYFRLRLSEAQNHRCCYCGCGMDVSHLLRPSSGRDILPPNAMTVEHVRPACQGGTGAWGNTVAACLDCNSDRKAKPLPVDLTKFDLTAPAPWHPAESARTILARRVDKARQRAAERVDRTGAPA